MYDNVEPDQSPVVAVSTAPVSVLPVTSGTSTLFGGASCTTALTGAAATLGAVMPGAVTSRRIVKPTSSNPSVCVAPVSPLIGTQLVPLASQRCQAYVNDPFRHCQVPGAAVSTEPCRAVPVIEGDVTLSGLKFATTGVRPDAATAVPAALPP